MDVHPFAAMMPKLLLPTLRSKLCRRPLSCSAAADPRRNRERRKYQIARTHVSALRSLPNNFSGQGTIVLSIARQYRFLAARREIGFSEAEAGGIYTRIGGCGRACISAGHSICRLEVADHAAEICRSIVSLGSCNCRSVGDWGRMGS